MDSTFVDVEEPGHDQHERKAREGDDDDPAKDPLRRIERGQHDAGDLDQNPGDPNVQASRTKHLSAAQFSNEVFHRPVCKVVTPYSESSRATGRKSSTGN